MAYMVKQIQPAGPVLVDRIIAPAGLSQAMDKARVGVKRLGYRLAKIEGNEMVFTERDTGVPIRVRVEEVPRHPTMRFIMPTEEERMADRSLPALKLPLRWVVTNRTTGESEWFAIPCDIKSIVREAAGDLGFPGNPRPVGNDYEFSMTFWRGRKTMTFDVVKRAADE